MKGIKEIAAAQLMKQKVSDIIGFVKAGNLPMVHGLVSHFNIQQSVVLLKGSSDEFQMGKAGKKVSMASWNPVLLAIA